jgi:hypothetical protein
MRSVLQYIFNTQKANKMQATKTRTLEDQIIDQNADCTLTEVAKQLEFLVTKAHQANFEASLTQLITENTN